MAGIRDKHRKSFLGIFTGETFVLRRIRASEFMAHLGMLPGDNSETLSDQLKSLGKKIEERSADPTGERDLTRFYLERGVRSPKIFFGDYDDCPDDQIHVDDLSDDAESLVRAISDYSFDFSGFKKKMDELLQKLKPASAGPGGEALLPAPDGAAPEGDGA
jgi:hypothetical protein